MICELKTAAIKHNAAIWKRIADDLSQSSRRRSIVNLININKFTKDNETIIVPGKVLGDGDLSHKVTVAAWNFSESAIDKLNKTGSKTITINDLMKNNPSGKGVRIIG